MAKLNGSGKWIVVAVVVVAVIIFSYLYSGTQNPAPSGYSPVVTASSTPEAGTSSTASSPSQPSDNGSVPVATPVGVPTPKIHFITPVANDQWKVGSQNAIVWDQEAGVTAEIDLLNASDLTLAGVILSESGPHQTSYTWDTRQIYLSRYSPLKKDIVAGSYVVRIKFDGNNLINLTSPVFTVTP